MTDSAQSPFRPTLFMRTWQLRDADAGALKLFTTLLKGRLAADWAVTDAGSVDLLVMPVSAQDPGDGVEGPGLVRLRIAAQSQEVEGAPAPVLVRPLQFEEVAALLQQLEPDLLDTLALRRVAPVPEPVAEPMIPAPAERGETAPVEPEPVMAAPAAEPSREPSPAPKTDEATNDIPSRAPLELGPGARVKLRRWPDPVQLTGGKSHNRLASQISATALERDDLLALSGLPAAEVDAFLQAMHGADLLEVLPPDFVAKDKTAQPSDSSAAEPVPDSLFGLIRRRLGIGN